MQTDKIKIRSNGEGAEKALEETARFSVYMGADSKSALQLRLLSEETISMVNAITGECEAVFWLESVKERLCRIHLEARTSMDYIKKQELIDVSTDKRNSAAKGIMGKIRELIETGLYSIDRIGQLKMEYGETPVMYGTMGRCDVETASMNACIYQWSLEKYRKGMEEAERKEENLGEEWDELEKSIVANIADDVRVAVSGDHVELVLEKRI